MAHDDDTPHYQSGIEVRRAERWAHRETTSTRAQSTSTASLEVAKLKQYLRSKTKFSRYDWNRGCNVELVADDVPWIGWQTQERLRLRVVSRVEESPLMKDTSYTMTDDLEPGPIPYLLRGRSRDAFGDELPDSEVKYKDSEIRLWPSDDQDIPDELADLMCPGGRSGEVKGVLAEEGLIYSIGTGREKQLILICFDPFFGFNGMRKLSDRDTSATETCGSSAEPTTNKGKRRADSMGSEMDHHVDRRASPKRRLMSPKLAVNTSFNNLSDDSHTIADIDSALELTSDLDLDTEPDLDLRSDVDLFGGSLRADDLGKCRPNQPFCMAGERHDSGIDLSVSPHTCYNGLRNPGLTSQDSSVSGQALSQLPAQSACPGKTKAPDSPGSPESSHSKSIHCCPPNSARVLEESASQDVQVPATLVLEPSNARAPKSFPDSGSVSTPTAVPMRPFWKEQAMYLQLRRGWWLR
jgi:hypothetical protein